MRHPLLLSALLVLGAGCATVPPAETGAAQCSDGVDNDEDGAVDCDEADCAAQPNCQAPPEICDNGIDDDGDFSIDCLDLSCINDPACLNPGFCGDDIINQANEDCDGPDLGAADCADFGFSAGVLGCAADCSFDLSGCTNNTPICGDGSVNQVSENCDGNDLSGQSCVSLGFDSGALDCAANCAFDTSSCVSNTPICGDGVINQASELCDGNDFDGLTCTDFGFDGGTPQCQANCDFNGEGCFDNPVGGGLVINEIDYDQLNTDAASFIEIFNGTGGTVSLSNFAVVLVNGNNDTEYARFNLSDAGATLASGQFLVIRNDGVTLPNGVLSISAGTGDFIQNGAPDGVALINTANNTLVDALSYENAAGGAIDAALIDGFANPVSLVEGSPFNTADTNDNANSLARVPGGTDTNNAASDWSLTTPSPGTF